MLSLAASFGLSVLLWQYIPGQDLHWMVLAFSVIILLAVGSDYNLLVVSRFKEEIHAGIKTGIVRAMRAKGYGHRRGCGLPHRSLPCLDAGSCGPLQVRSRPARIQTPQRPQSPPDLMANSVLAAPR